MGAFRVVPRETLILRISRLAGRKTAQSRAKAGNVSGVRTFPCFGHLQRVFLIGDVRRRLAERVSCLPCGDLSAAVVVDGGGQSRQNRGPLKREGSGKLPVCGTGYQRTSSSCVRCRGSICRYVVPWVRTVSGSGISKRHTTTASEARRLHGEGVFSRQNWGLW